MKQETVEIPWEVGSQTPASHHTHQQPQIGKDPALKIKMLNCR